MIKKEQLYNPIPIKSICYKDNLYEVTGKTGEIVLQNHLEKFFSEIEKMFGEYRKKLEGKAIIEKNYCTKCFLKNEEKVFWTTYIVIQILRMPKILELVEKAGLDFFNNISIMQARNLARVLCLPFFEEFNEDSDDVKIFASLFQPMSNMSFAIGIDKERKIITSDNPVFISKKDIQCSEYDIVIFPISCKLCLFLIGNEKKEKYAKNFLFPITDEIRNKIVKSMADTSYGKIYANHTLDKNELKYINEVTNDKE